MLRKALLFLLLFSFTIFAQVSFEDISVAMLPFSIIMTVILIALTYMLSGFFQNPQLAAWVKVEVKEVVASGIVVIIVFTILTSSRPFVSTFTGEADYVSGLNDRINLYIGNMQGTFFDLMKANFHLTLVSSYFYSTGPNLWFVSLQYSASPYNGIGIIISSISQSAGAVINAIVGLKTLSMLIVFFSYIVDKFAFGVYALRIFPFTRKIGTTLLALLLGAGVLLPIASLVIFNLQDMAFWSTYPAPPPIDSVLSPRVTNWDGIEFHLNAGIVALCNKPVQVTKTILSATEVVISLAVCSPLLFGPQAAAFYPCYMAMTAVWFPAVMFIVTNALSAIFLGIDALMENVFHDPEAMVRNLKPLLQGSVNLMVLVYTEIILITTITIIGTKSVSQSLSGEFYISSLERLI